MPGVVAVLTGGRDAVAGEPDGDPRARPQHRRSTSRCRPTRCASWATWWRWSSPRAAIWPRTRADPIEVELRAADAGRNHRARARPQPPGALRRPRRQHRLRRLATTRATSTGLCQADRVFKETFRQHRYANVPMEDARLRRPLRPGFGGAHYYTPPSRRTACASHSGFSTSPPTDPRGQPRTSAAPSDPRACLPRGRRHARGQQAAGPPGQVDRRSQRAPDGLGPRPRGRRRGRSGGQATTGRYSACGWTGMDQGAYPTPPFPSTSFGSIVRAVMPAAVSAARRCSFDTTRGVQQQGQSTSPIAARGRSRPWSASACWTSSRAS